MHWTRVIRPGARKRYFIPHAELVVTGELSALRYTAEEKRRPRRSRAKTSAKPIFHTSYLRGKLSALRYTVPVGITPPHERQKHTTAEIQFRCSNKATDSSVLTAHVPQGLVLDCGHFLEYLLCNFRTRNPVNPYKPYTLS